MVPALMLQGIGEFAGGDTALGHSVFLVHPPPPPFGSADVQGVIYKFVWRQTICF